MLPTGEDFFAAFLGILLAGGIPVPIYPPFRPDRIEDYVRREARTLENAQASFLITFSQARILSRDLYQVFARLLR
jgi:fatty-acyl-CoA synthase